MKYKTTIEIVTEAENKNDAMEIVGEYLSGNIISSVDMKCLTKPSYYCAIRKISTIALSAVMVIGLVIVNLKSPQGAILNIPGVSAIQPPLKTSAIDKKNTAFKKEWQDRQTKEALDYLKR